MRIFHIEIYKTKLLFALIGFCAHTKPVCNKTQEKGAVTSQKTDPDLPTVVQESPEEAWVSSGLLQGRGH